jgi:hypothetical protein
MLGWLTERHQMEQQKIAAAKKIGAICQKKAQFSVDRAKNGK